MSKYVIGVDFGSLSARAVLINAISSEILATAVKEYPHQIMSDALPDGTKLPPLFALQHPQDYVDVLSYVVPKAVKSAGVEIDDVMGLAIDFTACTMLPVDKDGVPLCFYDEFKSDPHAYVKLWKHHFSQDLADKLTSKCKQNGLPLTHVGGKISSEWLIPKVWETAIYSKKVFDNTYRFYEAADWLSLMLTGKESHSCSFLGFKGLWTEKDGYLPDDFLSELDPVLKGLTSSKISKITAPVGGLVGVLNKKGALITGLKEGTCLATPVIDAHTSLPALGVTGTNELLVVLGTSTCHMINSAEELPVNGVCGYCKNSVIPDLYTYEASQPSCGDQFEWFINNSLPEKYFSEAKKLDKNIHAYLREKAIKLKIGESGLLAIDWFNGNRSTLNDAKLSAVILGLDLRTRPEAVYRALIEGTAFGTRKIVENFVKQGLPVNSIKAAGGIAEKDELLMQIYADVLNRKITVPSVKFSAAYGSAIYAAVGAKIYPNLQSACKALAKTDGKTYYPIPENVRAYDRLYAEYEKLYEYFGSGGNNVMKNLIDIKNSCL